jgi:hypothetical protein
MRELWFSYLDLSLKYVVVVLLGYVYYVDHMFLVALIYYYPSLIFGLSS